MIPWSHGNGNCCNGNPFICKKLYYKYLASVDKPLQDIIDEFNRRKMDNKKFTEKVDEVMRTALQEHPEMVLGGDDALNKVQERMVSELCS